MNVIPICRRLGLAASLLLATNSHAEPAWPVSAARDGFSAQEQTELLQAFAPLKLAIAGNQTLYTYLNMAQFFPQHTVARSGSIRALESAPDLQLKSLKIKELTLGELITDPQSRIQGFIVLHQGRIVFESYPGMRAEDNHLWWSVAKVLAGTLTELLIDEGLIERDRKITHYLPEFSNSGWTDISVDNVLNMASGIDAIDTSEAYADPQSGIGALIYAERILAVNSVEPMTHDAALLRMQSHHAAGKRYEYSSANTNMLGLLLERVTGQRYSDLVAQRIWQHIGAEGDALLGLTPDGRAIAHGMFSSRLRDLARFGLLFTPSGHQPEILPTRVLARISDRSRNAHYANAPQSAAWAKSRLGEPPLNALAQWDGLMADGDLFKSGYDGQALYISPSRDVVIAMFSTSKDKRAYRFLRPIAQHFAITPHRGTVHASSRPPARRH